MGQTKEQRIIKQVVGTPTTQLKTAVATDMFLPNHSGIASHPEFKKAIGDISIDWTNTTLNLLTTGNGTFGSTNQAIIGSDNNYAFYGDDESSNSVYLADGTYAINATGPSTLQGNMSSFTTLQINQGIGGYSAAEFWDLNGSVNVSLGTVNYAGYFFAPVNAYAVGAYDGVGNYCVLADGTYAINFLGNIFASNSSASGVGYTGDLNDSTSTKIADVVSGIITAVYY